LTLTEKYSRRLFFFTLIFSPLAFGTVEPWSYAVMELAAFAALFLYFIHTAKSNSPFYEVPGLAWLLSFLVFILLQAVPMPSFLVSLISPASYEIQQAALHAGDGGQWMTVSVHPRATVHAFFRYSTYAAFYLLTVQLLTRKELFKKTVFVITVFGAVLAFSSILQSYLTEDKLLWFRHVAHSSTTVSGPYVNRNHYAGLMEMIFPVVLALFFFYRPRLGKGSLAKDIVEIFGQKKGNIHVLIGAAALLIVTSIFLSLSRGAIISTCLAFLIFLYLVSKRQMARRGKIPAAMVVILVCLSVSWFGWDPIFERFGELKSEDSLLEVGRIGYWHDTMDIIKDYPVAGAGMGAFADIYPSYHSMGAARVLDHAHNDYLELAAEGGILCLLFVFGFILTVFYKISKSYAARRDPYAIYICIGSLTGVTAILFHSFSDFNLQIGANGLWFFFMFGLAVSAANTRFQPAVSDTRLKAENFSGNLKKTALAAGGLLLAGAVVFNLSAVMGSFYYGHIKDYGLNSEIPAADLKKIQKIAGYASMFDPLNAGYDFAQADPAWLLSEYEKAEAAFVRAISKNPANALYYKRYGLFLAQAGNREKAAQMIKQSVVLDPVNSDNALEYGALLIATGKDDEGLVFLKKAVELDDSAMDKVLAALAAGGFSPLEAAAAVPDRPGAVIRYASFLADLGKRDAAAEKYLHVLELMEQGREVKRHYVYSVYRFFDRYGSVRQVMDVLQRASRILPKDARIRITLGDLYQQQGIFYKAEEKYEEALVVDPGNKQALQKLEQLSQ
jgi:O-antigen ligase